MIVSDGTSVWASRRFRIGVIVGVVALLAMTLILQNFDTTEVQFLFWRFEAPLAAVILGAIVLGAGLQWLTRTLWRRRKRQREALREASLPADEDR